MCMERYNTVWGISAFEHDAALSVIKDNKLVFASHSERFSRIKNDSNLDEKLLREAISIGGIPDIIVFYEKEYLSQYRKLRVGRIDENEFISSIEDDSVETRIRIIPELENVPIVRNNHHYSHAAASYYTSGFDEALVFVLDAIGEMESISVWKAQNGKLSKIHSIKYPHSVGLLYSAFTDRLAFKPNEEEFIMMALASYGKPIYAQLIKDELIKTFEPEQFELTQNLYTGIRWWHPEIKDDENIAASIQSITKEYILNLIKHFSEKEHINNICLAGGIALNCVINNELLKSPICEKIWIMPNPGDAGASLGAALSVIKKQIKFDTPFLGTEISRDVDVKKVVDDLIQGNVVGIANGRAEFGPRALGNRSLICDPRKKFMKDVVNEIKQREPFRPFAGAILEEHTDEYFDIEVKSPYMQYAVICKKSSEIPAVCHVDNSCRIQTVSKNSGTILYDILIEFYERTGCPVLLNTSLNIKGQPIVNSIEDAREFENKYFITVY